MAVRSPSHPRRQGTFAASLRRHRIIFAMIVWLSVAFIGCKSGRDVPHRKPFGVNGLPTAAETRFEERPEWNSHFVSTVLPAESGHRLQTASLEVPELQPLIPSDSSAEETIDQSSTTVTEGSKVSFASKANSAFSAPADLNLSTTAEVSITTDRAKYPIDLTTAMRLAGANHLQIQLAGERIREASARLERAEVMWIPDLNIGIGYNRHDGTIQDTSGAVRDVSRQSLYFGGGASVGDSPLSGGASGPARLFVDLSTADVLFEPLAARQTVNATQHALRVARNDNILEVGLGYQELVRSQMQMAIAVEAIQNAEQLFELTESFELAGKGLPADTQRAQAELLQRRHQLASAQEQFAVNSAELVRLLRLSQGTQLISIDPQPLPLDLIRTDTPIESLIANGLTRRPELALHQAQVQQTLTRIAQEQWRPWLPHLAVGYAGAGFGGGSNNDMQNFGPRGDFDALAVWQVQNLGFGNQALRRERESRHRQAHLEFSVARDRVIAEVTQAWSRARYRREQMEYAQSQVAAAADALPLNMKGIRDGVIRPIEAQQAIAGLSNARNLYLAAVIDFNQAQLELSRAIGDAQ